MDDFSIIVEFIRKLYNEPKGFIPLHAPVFDGNEKQYLNECIDSTFVSSVGKFVDRFEEEMAKYTGSAKAVACVNGTNALHLALLLAGVEKDDEVITQPLTFIATANAIGYTGAKPIFIDVDIDTMGLSPESLLSFLKNNVELDEKSNRAINKKTKKRISACVPMHTFGHPCRIDEIVAICNDYNIPVVEDAAESLGSFFKGQHTGTFGEIGILSFNGNKTITTGGGGMLLFKDEDLAQKAKHLSTQAKVPHPWEFEHNHIGYNYRMPNVNAAIGLAQLEQLPNFLKSKLRTAKAYKEFFENHKELNISFVSEPKDSNANYWLNCVLLKDKEQRDGFLKHLNENGVMTRPAWKLMNDLEMFRDCETSDLTNATLLAERLVNIPSSVDIE